MGTMTQDDGKRLVAKRAAEVPAVEEGAAPRPRVMYEALDEEG